MIELDKVQKLPHQVLTYYGIRVLVWVILIALFDWKVALVFGVVVFLYVWLQFSYKSFQVNASNFTYNTGIIMRSSKTVPFENVQNVDVTSGILQRMMGLAIVRMWTASPGQVFDMKHAPRPDLSILLLAADANHIRERALKK